MSHGGSRDGINRLKIELGFKRFICIWGGVGGNNEAMYVLTCAAG